MRPRPSGLRADRQNNRNCKPGTFRATEKLVRIGVCARRPAARGWRLIRSQADNRKPPVPHEEAGRTEAQEAAERSSEERPSPAGIQHCNLTKNIAP
jgi:hypothetical protein